MLYLKHKVQRSKRTTFKLIPLADWHIGERGHCRAKLKAFLREHDGPDTLYIGNGDLMSCIVPGDPRYDKATDATHGPNIIDEQIDACVNILTGLEGEIIGLGEGNHEYNYRKKRGHTNPVKRVCEAIDVPYIGYSRIVKLQLHDNHNRLSTSVYSHHGFGGCTRAPGIPAKYVRELYNFDAQIVMFGHDHRLQAAKFPQIGFNAVETSRHLVMCGSFLKTYETSEEPSYGEKAGYAPLVIGAPVIYLRPSQTSEAKGCPTRAQYIDVKVVT